MDAYTVDVTNKVVVIRYNMNHEIVRNKSLECIVPFE